MAERHLAAEPNSRASKALRAMLATGSVTTDDLNALGYNHPPRAIGDVRDAGIPVITERDRTPDGRPMARYRLGRAEDIQNDRHAGRSVLPKAFKAELLSRYGSADCITGAKLEPRNLQIDHRIPYRIAGDAGIRGISWRLSRPDFRGGSKIRRVHTQGHLPHERRRSARDVHGHSVC